MVMDERQSQILRECERFGENEVRRRLYAGEYSAPRDQALIQGWLRDIAVERERKLSDIREARDKEMILLTRSVRRIAICAMIIAIIASIIAIIGIIK